MGESKSIDYTRYIGKEIPAEIAESVNMFSIEYSIPMRKPKGHFSRAPGVLFSILESHKGGTFWEAQGYWQGVQEPVIYLMISETSTFREVEEKIRKNLMAIQNHLKSMFSALVKGSVDKIHKGINAPESGICNIQLVDDVLPIRITHLSEVVLLLVLRTSKGLKCLSGLDCLCHSWVG